MKLAGRGEKMEEREEGWEGGSVGGGEEEKSRGEIREKKKPKRALTKGPVNLQAPLTRGMDGNSLTACRIFFFFPPPVGVIKWLSGGKVAIICWQQHPALSSK